MTIGERIKAVRTDKKLTLEKFGEKIGIKKSSLSQIENGKVNVTDRVIKSICREFNVNEHWLLTGEGDMFLRLSRNDEIAAYVARVMKDESAYYQQKMLAFLTKLSPEMVQKLIEVAEDILSEPKKEQKD